MVEAGTIAIVPVGDWGGFLILLALVALLHMLRCHWHRHCHWLLWWHLGSRVHVNGSAWWLETLVEATAATGAAQCGAHTRLGLCCSICSSSIRCCGYSCMRR